MSWIEDIGTYLQTNGVGTLGTNIFAQGFEESVSNCIALFQQPGMPQKSTMTNDMLLLRPELGVRVRNVDDENAAEKADEIFGILNLITNSTIGTTKFKRIKAVSDPFFVYQDENNRFIYSINFSIEIT